MKQFRVIASASDGLAFALGETLRQESFEDALGRFEVDGLAPGTWKVVAYAHGIGCSEPLHVELSADLRQQRFVVDRAVTLRGRVVGPNGAPLAHAQIHCAVESSELGAPGPLPAETESDASGDFALAGLPPGTLTLEVRSLGLETKREIRVELGRIDPPAIVIELAEPPPDEGSGAWRDPSGVEGNRETFGGTIAGGKRR